VRGETCSVHSGPSIRASSTPAVEAKIPRGTATPSASATSTTCSAPNERINARGVSMAITFP
jgi:hypothetical protein